MLAMKLKKARRSERGQIMVLGVMGVLLVAIMMLLTLNIGQAVYEKIRLQQVSDSAAFSNCFTLLTWCSLCRFSGPAYEARRKGCRRNMCAMFWGIAAWNTLQVAYCFDRVRYRVGRPARPI